MDNKKFDLFLDRLLEKTEQAKIEWESTASRNTFLAALQDSAISISRSTPVVANVYYEFDFRDENGDVVDSVVVSEFTSDRFDKTEKIYNLAVQQSQRINQTLDHFLEQLAA